MAFFVFFLVSLFENEKKGIGRRERDLGIKKEGIEEGIEENMEGIRKG